MKYLAGRKWPMTVLLLAVMAYGVSVSAKETPQSPDWTLVRSDGSEFSLRERLGEKTYLVLFWATWCPYCKALMPHLESLVLEHADRDFEVLAITINEDGDPGKFLNAKGYDFTLLPDGEVVAELYGIRGTPGVLIIDKQGHIAFDLRNQQNQSLDTSEMKRRQIAARRAPFWAAQIRKALDKALD